MASGKGKRPREFLEGYREGVNDSWDEVLRMAAKGYTTQEFQIMVKSKRYSMLKEVEGELGIHSSEPEPGRGREDLDIQPGLSYLVKESRPEGGFALFRYALSKGKKGMCIVRTKPDLVRSRYGVTGVGIVWLVASDQSGGESLPPSALGIGGEGMPEEGTANPDRLPWLVSMIINFMDANNGGVVLLEGLEYLVTHNGFQPVLKYLQNINEAAARSNCNIIITASPSTMDPKDFSLLEREMNEVVEV
jgi:hypothetical protein